VEELPQGKQALWAYKWLKVPGGHLWHSSSDSALVWFPYDPGGQGTGSELPCGQMYPTGQDW